MNYKEPKVSVKQIYEPKMVNLLNNLKNQRKTTIDTLPKITLIKKSKGFTNQCQASVLPKSKPNPQKQYQYKYGD